MITEITPGQVSWFLLFFSSDEHNQLSITELKAVDVVRQALDRFSGPGKLPAHEDLRGDQLAAHLEKMHGIRFMASDIRDYPDRPVQVHRDSGRQMLQRWAT